MRCYISILRLNRPQSAILFGFNWGLKLSADPPSGTCTQTFTYDITLPSPLPGRSPSAPMASVDRYGMVLDPSKRSVPGFAVSGDGGVDP